MFTSALISCIYPYKVTDGFYIFKIFGEVMNTKAALKDFVLWQESCVHKACSANKYDTEQQIMDSTAVRGLDKCFSQGKSPFPMNLLSLFVYKVKQIKLKS